MNKRYFSRMAADNLRKNSSTVLPFFLTCVVTTAMYYVVHSLSVNPGLKEMVGSSPTLIMMQMASRLIAIFAVIFLFYTNSFLLKRRKKEFGLFHILGLEKRHLAQVLAWETLYLAVGSILLGLPLGIGLDKLMFLMMGKFFEAPVPLGFFISGKVILSTMGLFGGIFLLLFLNAIRHIHSANPIQLMQDSRAGEKEPKANWFLALLGLALTLAGYSIAITTKNPLYAVPVFFQAVLLVVIGTYFLFTAGSIALLKALKKSKRFYYKANHFVSVSGLLYRMKQNAVGLANICILSTMLLVMLSGTTSMTIGLEDALVKRHPYEFAFMNTEAVTDNGEKMVSLVQEFQQKHSVSVQNEVCYPYLDFAADQRADQLECKPSEGIVYPVDLFFLSVSDYNRIMGTDLTLEPDEVCLYATQKNYEYPTLTLLGKTYRVQQTLDKFPSNNRIGLMSLINIYCVVVPEGDLEWINQQYLHLIDAQPESDASQPMVFYAFDSDSDEQTLLRFYGDVTAELPKQDCSAIIEWRSESRSSFLSLYGGFFFIGIFLGVLFLMATVLIIYYKQITEGLEDRERYVILRQVGMSRREIKSAIHSQVVTVFFLPLGMAFLHTAMAFPLMTKLLAILNLSNRSLHVACTCGCCLVFAAFYLIVYLLTAKTYYKIVSR